MKQKKMVMVSALAEILGKDRSNVLKAVKKAGIETTLAYGGGGGQKTVFISEKDSLILKQRYSNNYTALRGQKSNNQCVFYLINIMPDQKEKVTCGISLDVDRRLKEYRSAWPEAKVIEKFPCKMSHETFLIDMLASKNKQVGPEHFIIKDLEETKITIKNVLSLVLSPSIKGEKSNGKNT